MNHNEKVSENLIHTNIHFSSIYGDLNVLNILEVEGQAMIRLSAMPPLLHACGILDIYQPLQSAETNRPQPFRTYNSLSTLLGRYRTIHFDKISQLLDIFLLYRLLSG